MIHMALHTTVSDATTLDKTKNIHKKKMSMTHLQSHVFHPSILRTYDIRGVVGDTLHMADAYAIARSLVTIAHTQGLPLCAVVGYDGRVSSPAFADHLIQGFQDAGVAVINVGLCPTPLLYMAGKELHTPIAVMITGSHNPPAYNGFKIMLNGASFFGKDIQTLGNIAQKGDWSIVETNSPPMCKYQDFSTFYVDRILQDYDPHAAYTIVWDTGNGAMGAVLRKITHKMAGTHIIINEEVDGTFPNHHPDPTVESNLAQLKSAVHQHTADMGIAFDGDGDRIGIIDAMGRVLWGDEILCILAKPVLKKHPQAKILSDVKASDVLFQEIERMGGTPVMVATGHSIVKSRMIEEKSPLAGEMSAHIFFADTFYGHDDALYAGIRFINAIYESGTSVIAAKNALPQMVNTPEIRIDISEDKKFPLIAQLAQHMHDTDTEYCAIDGVRVRTENGWWLCRASNTQNCITMRFEANTQKNLNTMIRSVQNILSKYGVPDWKV